MDKQLIEQYGEDILSYRLRTARQKKRMQYEDFDKQLLKLSKEEDKLYRQKRDLGWEPLIPPVQKGWKRYFVLREDVARSKQAEFYEKILKKINTYQWHYRRDFKIRKKRYGGVKYTIKEQHLLRPAEDYFNRCHFTEKEKQQFHEVYAYDKRHRYVKNYVFNEPWRFVLRVRPNMVDKVKKRDAVIEARMRAIRDYLDWNVHQYRLNRILDGQGRYKWWKGNEGKEMYEFKNKSLSQIMDLIRET